jgi:branched-chain amino acid transport system ATP-binding protein
MGASQPLLVARDVEAVYHQSIVALRGVSLTVGQGEIVALLGANGAGKTTFLKAVSNLLGAERGQVTGGSIVFDGEPVARRSAADLVAHGLVQVLEGRRCFKALTVEENLLTGAVARGIGRAAGRAALERVYAIFPRLEVKRRVPAGLTSGGEQQMTAIGRALMAKPRLVLLDEPSMGLAPMIVEDIFAVLTGLNRTEGLSLLVAEQNAAMSLRHAQRAYVLENGRAVLEGEAARLRQRDDIKAFYLGLAPGQATGAELARAS